MKGLRQVAAVLVGTGIFISGAARAQVINELYYDGPGADTNMFTEILGVPGTDLSGYSLVGVNGADGAAYSTINLAGVIPADGYFVVGQAGTVVNVDQVAAAADWQNGPDQVQLRQGSTILDSVCYGSTTFLTCEGTAATDVAPGLSLARCPDGSDTGDNSVDFVSDDTPTPGVANDICPTAPTIINEVLYDGTGTDTGMFTELKGNPGQSLDGFTLVGVNGNDGLDYVTIDLTGFSIPADGYFVVAQDATVATADLIAPAADFQNGPDEVELRLDGLTVDSVCYGTAAFLLCEGTAALDVAAGASLARCPDGTDTDDNAADFAGDPTPTPGAANDGECAGTTPTDYTLCQLAENDANGFPLHFGELVRVTDVVAIVASGVLRPPGSGLEIAVTQPSTGCCVTLFDFNYPEAASPIAEGQAITEIVGVVDFFNGKTEITSLTSVVLGAIGAVPPPTDVTTAELAVGGEAYDNCLIKICGARITAGTWPASGSANLTIDDGSGPTILRVDGDTDVDGTPQPTEPFTVTGITTQFDSTSPYTADYQIIPRRRTDIQDGVACPTPVFERSWGQLKEQYR